MQAEETKDAVLLPLRTTIARSAARESDGCFAHGQNEHDSGPSALAGGDDVRSGAEVVSDQNLQLDKGAHREDVAQHQREGLAEGEANEGGEQGA